MGTIITILAAVLVFCFLVVTHEFGHFLVAKACHVYVEDFSVGMGPRLLHWQGKETEYCLRAFPIGGWCKMRGEDEDVQDERAFCCRPVWQRIAIVAAGPLMNFVFAFLLYVVIYAGLGVAVPSNVIGEIIPDTPAAEAGLQAGDRIVEINGQPIALWDEVGAALNGEGSGGPCSITVERDGETEAFLITPKYDEETARWMLGVYSKGDEAVIQRSGIFRSIGLGVRQSVFMLRQLVNAIVGMITGKVPVEVSGPVGIVTVIGEAAHDSLRTVLALVAFLCLNLGLINLFPLPALDGCRIVFLLIEALRGKPMNRDREGLVHFIGLVLLMGLMLVITYQDIVRLVTG